MAKSVTAFSLYATGRGYGEAAKLIFVSEHFAEKRIQVLLPLCALICFGLEFLLKAWLLHNGFENSLIMRSDNRHDLGKLYQFAIERGLVEIHPKTGELIDVVGRHHAKHEYRYLPDEAEITILNWPLTFEIYDKLEAVVGADMQAMAKARAIIGKFPSESAPTH